MWFKNLTLYKLDNFHVGAQTLADALTRFAFTPCTDLQDRSTGFIPPRPDGALVYELEGQYLFTLCSEKKLLPASVVKEETARRAAAFEKEQGFKPGKKLRKELKEAAIDALLPKAFATRSNTRAWIDTRAGLLVIDSVSSAKADTIINALFKALEMPLNLRPLRSNIEPVAAMTDWVANDVPDGFTVDQDTVFAATGKSKAVVKFSNVTLQQGDAERQIEAGKRVTSLALTYDDKVSFVLTAAGAIKRVAPLGVLEVKKKEQDDETFAADFLLMTGELRTLVAEVVQALGGLKPYEPDLADQGAGFEPTPADGDAPSAFVPSYMGEPDPLYTQAVTVVQAENRASISLVQRHLRIGYNRAARLLDDMEAAGVVSTMQSNGSRTVQPGAGA
jgi:recombination associated protein RdgC